MNSVADDMLANKVAIDLDMFGLFMKNIIMSNLNGTLIITVENSGKNLRNTHFLKNPSKPYKLLYSIARAQYSASLLDLEMKDCFLLCREINKSLRKKH